MASNLDIEETLAAESAKDRPTLGIGQRALAFLKEWGGAATVLIAIL